MSEQYQRTSCKSSRCEPQSPFGPRADTALRPFSRAMHSSTRPMMSIANPNSTNLCSPALFASVRRRLHSTEASVSNKLSDLALDQLFRVARTRNGWTDRPVTEQQLHELYDLVKLGPTSGNSCPARFVWVGSAEAKKKLAAFASPNNAPKILAAPVTVIVGYDLNFAEQLLKLFPAHGKDMQAYFADPEIAFNRFSEQQPSGCLSDFRSALARTGLRSDVRF